MGVTGGQLSLPLGRSPELSDEELDGELDEALLGLATLVLVPRQRLAGVGEDWGEVSNFPLAADAGVRHGMATLCLRQVISPDRDLPNPMHAQVRKITRTLTFSPPEIQTASRSRPYGNGLAIPGDPVPK